MIASLTGRVDTLEADRCVVEVGGVGYLVHASTRTLGLLPPAPALARLLVETQLREDAIMLYGFADTAEREWFRLLTTVQGVGAKVALNILSVLAPDDLASAVVTADRASLTRASGVGQRLAVRLLTELRDRIGGMPSGPALPTPQPGGVAADALSALMNLGYRRPEISSAVARAMERLAQGAKLDAVIRESLKELGR
ncbi:MAG: Holliday junction branch migration protein RuvA [Acidisphaera sp.]|nr:Holliday junction branch migration protein RuvA [Acidisphaera sp.]